MTESSYRLFFKAFSNKTRFEIIKLLRLGSRNVNQIVQDTGFEQSRVSHNLKCLEDCGFVNSEKNGNNKLYKLDETHILPILNEIDKHIETYDERLDCCGVLKK